MTDENYRKAEGADPQEYWNETSTKNNGWLIAGTLVLIVFLVFIAPYLVNYH